MLTALVWSASDANIRHVLLFQCNQGRQLLLTCFHLLYCAPAAWDHADHSCVLSTAEGAVSGQLQPGRVHPGNSCCCHIHSRGQPRCCGCCCCCAADCCLGRLCCCPVDQLQHQIVCVACAQAALAAGPEHCRRYRPATLDAVGNGCAEAGLVPALDAGVATHAGPAAAARAALAQHVDPGTPSAHAAAVAGAVPLAAAAAGPGHGADTDAAASAQHQGGADD